MNSFAELKTIDRLSPLARLSLEPEKILTKHNIVETLLTPSPYLASVGIEVELLMDRYPNGVLPQSKIDQAISAGMKKGVDVYSGKGYKEELDLRPVSGTHVVHAQEISLLKKVGILHLKKNRHSHDDEFYPVHINLGIPSDIRGKYGANTPTTYLGLHEWASSRTFEYSPIIEEVLGRSDSLLLARIFDATGWATSADRILGPYKAYKKNQKMSAFLHKGVGGVNRRSKYDSEFKEEITEIRTCELWGEKSLAGFQRYLKSIQYVGGALKSYMKLPMQIRDKILLAELNGDTNTPIEEIMRYDNFDLSHDADLAYLWHELRHNTVRLFDRYSLENPMKEYNGKEFGKLAKHLPTIGKSPSQLKMVQEARSLVTEARRKVMSIIS